MAVYSFYLLGNYKNICCKSTLNIIIPDLILNISLYYWMYVYG